MSLWFAGLGLLTLVGALLLNQADGGGIEVEFPGAQKVDALRPGPLPGPAPETRDPASARDVLRPLPVPERAPESARELPIGALDGTTSNPGSSWKENHERPAPPQPALAEQVRGGLDAPPRDVVEPAVPTKAAPSKSAAPPRSKPKPAATATAPRPKPRPAPKKAASDGVDGDSEVDFGI